MPFTQSLAYHIKYRYSKALYQIPINYGGKQLLGSWNKDQLHSKWVSVKGRSVTTFLDGKGALRA